MKSHAVVCGGGLMGLSVAYHLAKKGASVLLFEKNFVGSHSGTRLTTGLLTSPMFYADQTAQYIAKSSFDLYYHLASNGHFRYNPCGRVYLADSLSTEIELKRMHSRYTATGTKCELIENVEEIFRRWPMLTCEDLKLAFHSFDDVTLDVEGLCQQMALAIQKRGGKIFENCSVKNVLLSDQNQVYAVDTDAGIVETNHFVNAAGIWSNKVPVKGVNVEGIKVSVYPVSYTFLSTLKLPHDNVGDQTPVFIDCDNQVYLTPTESRTICGGFAKIDFHSLGIPMRHTFTDWQIPNPNWDNFYPALKRLLLRFPSLNQLPHGDLISGAEMFTPDSYPIIGETHQFRGYFVANGLNNHGVTMAGGLGHILADWILRGQPNIDVCNFDVTRFLPNHNNSQYLFERVPEVASNVYKTLYYNYQSSTARNLRMSPISHYLHDAGAVFGEIMGYERPLWYNKDHKNESEHIEKGLFTGQDSLVGLPEWFFYVSREYEACRERVGLIDMTSFSKFDLKGRDIVRLLQLLCSANIDRPVGTTVYTGMQNDNGGYITDCTMSRSGIDSYFVVSPTVQQIRFANWVKRWATEWNMDVQIQDVTSSYTALNLVGPCSRYLMEDITGQSMTSTDFPSFSYRELNIGMATGIRAISVTNCGELGWVIFIPNEVAQNVYQKIIDAGIEYSLQFAGYYALRHLRIEKFYVYWGDDINTQVTPVECGRTFRVDFNKDFIGKKALLKQLEVGVLRRYVQIFVDKHRLTTDPWPQGQEPLFRDGKLVGWTTSAAYGFTLASHVCLGYIENKDFGISTEFINSGSYEIEIAGKRFPIRVNTKSPSLPMISSEHPNHYRPTQ